MGLVKSSLYEPTEDRLVNELCIAPCVFNCKSEMRFEFRAVGGQKSSIVFGENGQHYIDGYIQVYSGEQVCAMQDKRSGRIIVGVDSPFKIEKEVVGKIVRIILKDFKKGIDTSNIKVYGRFDNEWDFGLAERIDTNTYKVEKGALNEFNSIWC